jgi:hypothetical protein
MRFSTISILTLVGSAIAAPVVLTARDDSALKYNINRINSVLTSIDSALSRKPRSTSDRAGSESYAYTLISRQQSLNKELRDSTDDLRRSRKTLTLVEAVALQSVVNNQEKTVNKVVKGWIDAKPYVQTANRVREVRAALQDGQREFDYFSDAVISVLPTTGVTSTLGQGLKSRFNAANERAIRVYSR